MYDAVSFEKLNVPAAVICTEPFISSGKAMLEIVNLPDYPMAIVPHPIGSLSKSELRELAMKIAPEIIQILTTDS